MPHVQRDLNHSICHIQFVEIGRLTVAPLYKLRLALLVPLLRHFPSSCYRHLGATHEFLLSLMSAYHVSDRVVFEILGPWKEPSMPRVLPRTLLVFPSMFSCGLRLLFPCPICKVLDCLRLAPSQLHPNAWRILMYFCIMWWHALLRPNPEHADLTSRKFLLTYNVIRRVGNIYSFRVVSSLVVLDPRYHKIKDLTSRFFFMLSWQWKFPIKQNNSTEFPIRPF